MARDEFYDAPVNTPVTVLLADDHPIFRRGLLDVLRSAPTIQVVQDVADGETALRVIRELQPAVAILDVQMPGLTGLDVARQLQHELVATQLVFLTMFNDEETLREALDLGVRGYVLKDSAAEEIVGCVRTVTQGRHFISSALSGFLVRRADDAKHLAEEKGGLTLLTPGERRILKLVSEARTTKEIADQLGLSPRTVETHRQNICYKLELQGVHSLVKFAYDNKSRL